MSTRYLKRPGTSAICGQLYETRLLSLIFFRLLHDDSVEEFYLASNMANVGVFDDICFKAKIKGLEKPILVFIQARHRSDNTTVLNYDLIKNIPSFIKVKDNFDACKNKNQEVFFKGNFEEIECLFILYTNAQFVVDSNVADFDSARLSVRPPFKQIRKPYHSSFAGKLSDLIGTGDASSQGSQAHYTEQDLQLVNDKITEEEITILAERFVKFLNDQSMNIMLDKYIVLYHVILAQRVVYISEVKSEEIISTKKETEKNGGQKTEQISKNKSNLYRPEQSSERKSEKNYRGDVTANVSDGCKVVHIPEHEEKKAIQTHEQSSKGKAQQNKTEHIAESESEAVKPEHEQKEKKPVQNTAEVRYRELTFRPDFITTDDKSLMILRNKILYEIVVNTQVKNKKKPKVISKDDVSTSSNTDSDKSTVEKQISDFLSEPSVTTLSPLIGTHIIDKNGTLKFAVERPSCDLETLEMFSYSEPNLLYTVYKAKQIAAKNFLISLKLKVPTTFGNMDFTIAGDADKIERRLNFLTHCIDKLCQKSESVDMYNIVKIDRTVSERFLALTGGIGSAVGNLLIYDKATKLLKFTKDYQSLKPNARTLFEKLMKNKNISSSFDSYRFDVKAINNFPKLAFDYTEDVKNILNKFVVFDKQSNCNEVEKILREEIERHQLYCEPQCLPAQSDNMVVYYHNEIQKRWMTPNMDMFYTKSSDTFEKANDVISEPKISSLQNTFYVNKINNNSYNFNKAAIKTIASVAVNTRTIIVSNIPTLSTIKVIQCLRNKNQNRYAVLDLECMLNLPLKEFNALNNELINTKQVLIFMCDNPKRNRILHKRLDALAEATVDRKVIVITNNTFAKVAQEYFEDADDILNDERHSLIDLTPETWQTIIKTTSVIFQGDKVNLDLLIDDESVAHIKGAVLNKLVRNEIITIGTSLSTPNYEKMQHLYIERKVHLTPHDFNSQLYDYIADRSKNKSKPKGRFVTRIEDIYEDHVLITAEPGMGKSTLLTRLSLKAKEYNKGLWIVRINLLDHSKAFFDWQTHQTVVDTLETLKIICQVILKSNSYEIRLKEISDKVYLEGSTGNEWADFELNMFLNYYNRKILLFLFDGFDEICPHYKDNVIEFLNVVINYPSNHKMWVTSRPYSEILPDLQKVLGRSYDLEYINDTDQEIYLKKYWQENLIIENLESYQLKNVISYIDFMKPQNSLKIGTMFHLFYDYVRWYFPHIVKDANLSKMIPIVLNPQFTGMNAGLLERGHDIMMGTPLLLYLFANYFVNLICDSKNNINWQLHLEDSSLAVFEMFAKTKLKILFQDKNEVDIHKPDVLRLYEKKYTDCLNLHKKLAAHTLLFKRIHLDELKDVQPFKHEHEYEIAIKKIKCGVGNIGLVSHVTADLIPVFIYKSLEEYFATEFLSDTFKDESVQIAQKNMLYSIAHITFSIFSWINKKRAIDEELNNKIREIELNSPHTVDNYGYLFASGWSTEHLIRIRSSTANDYEADGFADCNEDFNELRRLEPAERERRIKEFQMKVISKMKPHLRQYFTTFPREES